MTHESRGLDTCPLALKKLQNVKDTESIAVLKRNIKEEVTHVGAGVKWFEHMCEAAGIKDPVMHYHNIVKDCFDGIVKGPFDHESRSAAGMKVRFHCSLYGGVKWRSLSTIQL